MSPRERVSQAVGVVRDGSLWTWNHVVVCWQFLMAPLVSHWRGLSLVRFLCVFIAVAIGHEVFVHEKSLTWIDFWFMLAAIAASFGKPIFAILLSRVGLKSGSMDTVQTQTLEIHSRRDAGKEWDAEAS